MADHPFAKDLGYLFPFFERVTAHAATLPEAEAAELRALLEGAPARWRRIAALLEGGEASAEAPMDTDSAEVPRAPTLGGWTVGPLNRG
ncbi:MAG: hypothetical protein H6741_06105 [Alphaproteobacteria bacterium]|nr:hypothetical protein [Alphaproteobacteria bacterium]MCB9792282.1 hypothetical protein [Alphaproteobacteria bacterium]